MTTNAPEDSGRSIGASARGPPGRPGRADPPVAVASGVRFRLRGGKGTPVGLFRYKAGSARARARRKCSASSVGVVRALRPLVDGIT